MASLALAFALALAEPLPEPLTLAKALELAEAPHPAALIAEARLAGAEARRLELDAAYRPHLELLGELAWIEPNPAALNRERGDHSASLRYSQRLFDFGLREARERAIQQAIEARRAEARGVRLGRGLEVMARFLDVILADLTYARDNEAMAVAFVRLDDLKERQALGEISEVEMAEAEAAYQAARLQRTLSQARQRSSRARLAGALNRPASLPSELAEPSFKNLHRPPPELEALIQEVLAHNPSMEALRRRLESARWALEAARASTRPDVSLEAEVSRYARDIPSRDRWRAGLTLTVPLLDGGEGKAAAAEARAAFDEASALLRAQELALRQRVLELWQAIDGGRVALEEAEALAASRELKLDRARALYELEVNADLGDAMVGWSQARLHLAEVRFRLALAWAELNVLRGKRAWEGLL